MPQILYKRNLLHVRKLFEMRCGVKTARNMQVAKRHLNRHLHNIEKYSEATLIVLAQFTNNLITRSYWKTSD